ncbi:alkaline phosphatase family protein [Paraburkholderia caribensis]|uniref:alkaline phosphatase family protein n=1 Tax=Paraburkholderia caribensis TaxID=75105 RepID=UPI0012E81A0B|nr:alkaline phosphatase family protein [Paraburkholderia caribensis]
MANDNHRSTGGGAGQTFVADVSRTLISNVNRWKNALFIVTCDEDGGFCDMRKAAKAAVQPYALSAIRNGSAVRTGDRGTDSFDNVASSRG